MTRLNSLFLPEQVTVSSWNTRQDLIDCLVACCYIPVYCGKDLYQNYRNERVMDGWFSRTSNTCVSGKECIVLDSKKYNDKIPEKWLMPKMTDEYVFGLYELGKKAHLDLNLKIKSEIQLKEKLIKDDSI